MWCAGRVCRLSSVVERRFCKAVVLGSTPRGGLRDELTHSFSLPHVDTDEGQQENSDVCRDLACQN